MHVALVQLDIAWEDKSANHRAIEGLLAEAELPVGSFVLLPELGDTGFSFNLARIVDDRTLPWASALARRHGAWVQVGHAVRGPDGRGRNCATLIGPDGAALGTYQKVHPFSYGREAEHFGGGDHLLLGRCGDAAVAPLICYDLRFPELWRHAALAGAEVIALGASWPAARQDHWRALLVARAIENQAFVLGCNRVGRDPHLAYAGGSIVVDPRGRVLVEGDDRQAVLTATLDLADLRAWRAEFPALSDVRRSMLGTIRVETPIKAPVAPSSPASED
ncbi:MAG: nitrilase-related carbon-nitrogen hydrolase [Planctomycetota bacterium]